MCFKSLRLIFLVNKISFNQKFVKISIVKRILLKYSISSKFKRLKTVHSFTNTCIVSLSELKITEKVKKEFSQNLLNKRISLKKKKYYYNYIVIVFKSKIIFDYFNLIQDIEYIYFFYRRFFYFFFMLFKGFLKKFLMKNYENYIILC